MTNSPLISVIIPIYNVEKYLDRCIMSIVNQTYNNLEIILVDDGSPDNCPQMCDDWAKRDNRIQVIHKINGGLAAARNSGMELANGDYIAFLDSDDYLDLETYETMLLDLRENEADIISWGMVRESENGYKEEWGHGEFQILTQLDAQRILGIANGLLPVHSSNKLYSKAAIGNKKFDESLRFAEDIMFNFEVLKNIQKMLVHNVNFYHYTNNTSSISYKKFDYARFDEHKVMDIILDYAKNNVDLYPYCVVGDVKKSFRTIKQMCISNSCMDMYPKMRQRILGYRKVIFHSGLCSKELKIKTLFLMLFPHIYKTFIRSYGIRADKKYASLAGFDK